jgi:hypothetical protein
MSGIEPKAFRMRNGRSTTELHPLIRLYQLDTQFNPNAILEICVLNFKKFLQIKLFGHEEHERYCTVQCVHVLYETHEFLYV